MYYLKQYYEHHISPMKYDAKGKIEIIWHTDNINQSHESSQYIINSFFFFLSAHLIDFGNFVCEAHAGKEQITFFLCITRKQQKNSSFVLQTGFCGFLLLMLPVPYCIFSLMIFANKLTELKSQLRGICFNIILSLSTSKCIITISFGLLLKNERSKGSEKGEKKRMHTYHDDVPYRTLCLYNFKVTNLDYCIMHAWVCS